MKFGRKDSRKPLEPKENHYAEVLSGNNNTSTDNIHGSINYVDLGLQPKSTSANDIWRRWKHLEMKSRSVDEFIQINFQIKIKEQMFNFVIRNLMNNW